MHGGEENMNENQQATYSDIAVAAALKTPFESIAIEQTPTYLQDPVRVADFAAGLFGAFGASVAEVGMSRGLPSQDIAIDRRHAVLMFNGYDRPDSERKFAFTDLALGIPLGKFATVSVGKQKEGLSQEMEMVATGMPFMERGTIATALLPTRNTGVKFFGNALKQRMTWSAGWFNNWLAQGNIYGFGLIGNQYVGRVNGLPFYADKGAKLLQLGVGYRYSDSKDGKFRFHSKGEDNQGPDFVNTASFPADYSNTFGLQAAVVTGPFFVQSEYLRTVVEAPKVGDPRFQGYYVVASYFLTGEHRVYSTKGGFFEKANPKSPFHFFKGGGGPGAWEVAVGQSDANLNSGAVQGGNFRRAGVALSWYPTDKWRFEFNYGPAGLNKNGIDGHTDFYQFRIQWQI